MCLCAYSLKCVNIIHYVQMFTCSSLERAVSCLFSQPAHSPTERWSKLQVWNYQSIFYQRWKIKRRRGKVLFFCQMLCELKSSLIQFFFLQGIMCWLSSTAQTFLYICEIDSKMSINRILRRIIWKFSPSSQSLVFTQHNQNKSQAAFIETDYESFHSLELLRIQSSLLYLQP